MENQQLIIRFDHVSESDEYLLRRLVGTVTADSIIKLIDIADLKANPREAKTGNVTDEIIESLESTSEIFHFKSKGLLLAAGDCEPLERRRYRLSFHDPDIEGILDGGHNMLALALYILRCAVDDDPKHLKGVRRWDDVKQVWDGHRAAIDRISNELEFVVPVEIIYPHASAAGQDAFQDAILDIAQARNNNAQLTLETKAHKAGYYDVLKQELPKAIQGQVEWKTNDGGRIKARDLVALAWVPLSVLEDPDLPGVSGFNPVSIYRNKGVCTKLFNRLIEHDGVSRRTKGDMRELIHPGVKSALEIMKDLPRLYDLIYMRFPSAYNAASSGFGRIGCVRIYSKSKKADKTYLRKPPLTRFFQHKCEYDFPDGFIMPLVWALRELMVCRSGRIEWKVDPEKFIESNLDDVMRNFYSTIQLSNYDPQKVGKTHASYNLASSAFRFLIK